MNRRAFLSLLTAPVIVMLLAGCKELWRPFNQGDIVHHKSDGAAAVVSFCENEACWVNTSEGRRVWRIYEIEEKPANPEPQ